jgi:hypothetical protein
MDRRVERVAGAGAISGARVDGHLEVDQGDGCPWCGAPLDGNDKCTARCFASRQVRTDDKEPKR